MVSFTNLRTRPSYRVVLTLVAVGVTCALLTAFARSGTAAKSLVPDPAVDKPLATAAGTETMVVAGGCFWGVQAVFQHVKGVVRRDVGICGRLGQDGLNTKRSAPGRTGHAESVKVTYDPSRISYGQLLKIFFSVAHDPTQLNEQGPDVGPQYRSVVFVGDDTQQHIAQAYVSQLGAAKVFRGRIVTDIVARRRFTRPRRTIRTISPATPSTPTS